MGQNDFMPELTLLSRSDQVAAHLRGELLRGIWRGEMPGTPLLAAELGIDRKIITAALCLLEEEGLLVAQGAGRRRRIVRWADNVARGKDDRRQTLTKAEFVEGGTIGPVPGGG